jgi:[protein-PII] uridylyltransferase
VLDGAALRDELTAAAHAGRDDTDRRTRALEVLRAALEQGRAEVRRRLEGGLNGLEAAKLQAEVADDIVCGLYAFTTTHIIRSRNPTEGERLTVAATGGYGRGVLAPYSDLDLLFLRPWKATAYVESVIEFMLYALWDLGLKVGHASRTVDECLRAAKADMTIRTALLDARRLNGDKALFAELRARFCGDLAAGSGPEFVAAKLAERDARHAKAGATRYLVEPNVKEGKGALRDLNTLLWIARYLNPAEPVEVLATEYFDGRQIAVLKRAYDFFWAVRAHLHHAAGRAEERLGFDLQPEVARRMGYARGADDSAAVRRFMRRYFLMTREVGALTRVFCAKLEAEQATTPARLSRLLPASLRVQLPVGVKGFRRHKGRLTLTRPEVLQEDPVNLIRLFAVADERDLDLHPDAAAAVAGALRAITPRLRREPKARKAFLDLLARGKQPYRSLSLMNETGVLARFLPEFGQVVAQTQFDRHHAYTVDEHTLRAIGVISDIEHGLLQEDHPLATALFPRIRDREALYLAMLLHDVGKGGEGGQLVAGPKAARRACERLGLAPERVELVGWLVENHLVFSDYAQKRDVSDPGTVAAFAEIVGDLERLRLLLILTVADIRAVGPGVWNGWKGQLMRELYAATEAVFRGGQGADAASRFRRRQAEIALEARRALVEAEPAAAAFAAAMEDAYFTSFLLEEQRVHARLAAQAEADGAAASARLHAARNAAAVTVAARDRPGLFADLAATLTSAGAQVLYARIHTGQTGLALDVFQVQDATGAPYGADDPRALASLGVRMTAVAAGREPAPSLGGRKRQARGGAAGAVTFDTASSEDALIVEVSARDRPGLLADLARAVTDAGLTLLSAHVGSYGDRAVDAFYVTDADGTKPADPERLKALCAALLDAVAEPGRAPVRPAVPAGLP